MSATPEACPECGKKSGFDGCAHVVCPKRKPVTARHPRTAYAPAGPVVAHPRLSDETLPRDER